MGRSAGAWPDCCSALGGCSFSETATRVGSVIRPQLVKVNRNGQATVLTPEQLDQLLAAAPSARYRALWSLQRWSAARISETLALTWGDVVAGHVTYRKATTKTKATRQIRCTDRLAAALAEYRLAWAEEHGHAPIASEALFPAAGSTTSPMSRQAADKALRATAIKLGFEGVSTHSFRRSFATGAVKRGATLPAVQRVTGHSSLAGLTPYIEVDQEDVMAALAGA